MHKNKNILIFGGSGFIGSHLIKRAIKLKMSVTSFSRLKPISVRNFKKVEYIYGDVAVKKNFKKIKKYYDYVINLSGSIDHSNKREVYRSHFVGVKNIADFCISRNVQHLIQIGSSGEYGDAKSPHTEKTKCLAKTYYNRTKLMATNYLLKKYLNSKLQVTILRPYQVYGPLQSVNRVVPITIVNCLKKKSFNCSDGNQYRDFLYIDDLIDAILLTVGNKKTFGEIFNLGSGKLIKIKNIINKINKIIDGGKPVFGVIPMRKDETLKIYPSISKAKKILNWYPKQPLEPGLKKTINDYKININKLF